MKQPVLQNTKTKRANFLINKAFKSFSTLKMIILIVVLSSSFQVFAQEKINFLHDKNTTLVKSNSFEATEVNYSFEGLNILNVETERGTFTELIMPLGYSVGSIGTPKLPAAKDLIEVPFGAEVHVEVINYTVEEYRLEDYGITNKLMPVQPSLRKDQDVSEVPFEYNDLYYQKKDYITPEIASVEVLGVLRGQRIARLTVAPVSYNPQEGILRVANNIELEIQYKGADIELTNYIKASTFSPYFDVVYNRVLNPFSNRDVFDDHPDLMKYPVKMLIVSHRDFEETLAPFKEWKTKQGFELEVAYTDDIGTTPASIQQWIHDQYNDASPEDPAPTFVIVVGDPSKLPASATGSASGQVTDLYYASVDGDYFPEMYIGRLSARNVQELQNQIDKILYYQKYEFEDPSYLDDVTLIAGQDGYWNPAIGQPTVNYGTQNYFNEANGFTNVNAYLSSYSGCYDEERIAVSLINFTAHCSPTAWAGPYLTVSDVHNMTNEGRYPLAIGNCCQSARFSNDECIGEAWVRAEGKGAVAYIGSAPNTHWFEDFYWAVGAFPIQGNNNGYVPTVEETTLGVYDASFTDDYYVVAAKKFVGNLAITEAHLESYPTHSNVQWYWEGYHTFGDPSTVIYLTQGSENEVSHLPTLPLGMDSFNVSAPPGSYVSISKDGVLHGAAFVGESGEVDVPITPVVEGGDVTIVVTKPQYIPYIDYIPAATLDGPFVVLDEFVINDPGGTQQANYGESFSIDITVKNVGADPVSNVTANLYGADDYISLLDGDNTIEFDNMGIDENDNYATVQNAYNFEIAQDVPDQHQAVFELVITDGTEQWTSNLRITANAPVLSVNPDYTIDDSTGGDGNGRLDPGESAKLIFEVTNTGNAIAGQPVSTLFGDSPYFNIDDQEVINDPVSPGETANIIFNVSAHPSSPEGTLVNLEVFVEDGHWTETASELIIGQVPETVIGEGTTETQHYPFYNYYKANRSQMLYTIDELGHGEKTITELGMDVTHITSTSEHQQLPNFIIMVKHTDLDALATSFVDMSDAEVVFEEELHQMPTQNTGWHTWDINSFDYDGNSNLIIEIRWGMLDTWCAFNDYYRVNGTVMDETRAVFGYSDNDAVPGYNSNSNLLPNLYIAFAAEETAEEKEVSFLVKDEYNNLLEGAGVVIGSKTKYTDVDGTAGFILMPGQYAYSASKDGYGSAQGFFDVGDNDIQITVVLEGGENIVEEGDTKLTRVYPNPSRGIVNVEISGLYGDVDISIMNHHGQIISGKSVRNNGFGIQESFNLRNLAKGIYYIRIKSEDETIIEKIILQ